MELIFPDLTRHPEWLPGQSKPWCDQLAAQTGRYAYTWNCATEGVSAEDLFAAQLAGLIRGRVLDVGCGHGEFTSRWAEQADEVVGYDMTEGFLTTARRSRKPNVRYVLGRTHEGLPFEDGYFDVAYTRKGPTSWYSEASRILRPGGELLALHPGDGNGEGGELSRLFPGLFAPSAPGTPILDKIRERLAGSGLPDVVVRVLRDTVYLPSAEDVVAMAGFGQNERVLAYLKETSMDGIRTTFERNRGERGLQMTSFHYLLHAKAPESQRRTPNEKR
ncbi:class I SAM-dependent methyltransferase [Paenibacillus arenilitoris]|uniref:Class I SAM-dependent methyltransferase n=1 Tax=Paenibacillus arenilitoris TaxID=2772299 RepID=A0A927CGR4_9BACL|nr:class I SAM-dependent methyltransferase [Paenibacillus arenilitoris]MBD2867189.1 class I SAM-dependent methyltransferase [Paenibacillus arenilitoris]